MFFILHIRNGQRAMWRPSLPLLAVLLFALPVVAAEPGALKEVRWSGGQRTVRSLEGKRVVLAGDALLVLTDQRDLLAGGEVRIESQDAWVVFRNQKPSVVKSKHLASVSVLAEAATLGVNVRLAPVVNGAVLVPHPPDYPAVRVYNRPSLKGEERVFAVHKYYGSQELGEDEDKIASFVVKKGYMATLAENQDGSGASQVFIARDQDLEIKRLPGPLSGKVSFVRAFPWRWTGKKGFGGKAGAAEALNTHWRYDWSANGESTLDMEYVPMRHNRYWDSWKKINSKRGVTHVLGFNEPMQKDQSNMTVDECLRLWPKLQESGLRIGSLCPTDGSVGWLYDFMDKADRRGLRVDFVSVHYYKPNWTARQLVGWLKKIHDRTGRPIWLTEFNNGAPWTKNHNPSMAQNAKRLDEFCRAMDQAPFVERYAVFNLGDKRHNRQVLIDSRPTLAGKRYGQNPSAEAFLGEQGLLKRRAR